MKSLAITDSMLNRYRENVQSDPIRKLASLALSRSDITAAAYDPAGERALPRTFSVDIPTMEVTDQQNSGRCWLFAATNVLRERIAAELNLEKFELSQSYLAFWDKFERAGYFLESILQTADLPVTDRTVAFILSTGVHDGGQWDMFVNIVRKYGIVPKSVYGETYQTNHTNVMNHYLNRSLKACAVRLRKMVREGVSDEMINATREEMLGQFYGYLVSCYGEPPRTFDFEYTDKDKKYHIEPGYTPVSFRDRYVGDLLDRTVSIIHAPTADKPYEKTYTVRYLGNVVGGAPVKHLNLELTEFKNAIIRQLKSGKVVWFGSDVGKFGVRDLGIWDDKCYNVELLTGLDLNISKEDALDYGFAAMNHAMVITGVNLDANGEPNRWKIENSWGEDRGEKGYYVCSDSWFDEYVFQAAVEREYLGNLAALYDSEPIELDPWDPMGTLAE